MSDLPETVFCFFRVRAGCEDEMIQLTREHCETLVRLGLCTDAPHRVYSGKDGQGRSFLIKLFEWRGAAALDAARKHPDVQILWERMDALCESRDGQPNMEFPHVEPVAV